MLSTIQSCHLFNGRQAVFSRTWIFGLPVDHPTLGRAKKSPRALWRDRSTAILATGCIASVSEPSEAHVLVLMDSTIAIFDCSGNFFAVTIMTPICDPASPVDQKVKVLSVLSIYRYEVGHTLPTWLQNQPPRFIKVFLVLLYVVLTWMVLRIKIIEN